MVLTGMAIINFINLIVGVMSNRHFAGKGLEADSMASLQIVQRGDNSTEQALRLALTFQRTQVYGF